MKKLSKHLLGRFPALTRFISRVDEAVFLLFLVFGFGVLGWAFQELKHGEQELKCLAQKMQRDEREMLHAKQELKRLRSLQGQ